MAFVGECMGTVGWGIVKKNIFSTRAWAHFVSLKILVIRTISLWEPSK